MNIPPELIVFFSSMLPVTELRGSIPLGFLLGLPPEAIFFWAIVGNFIPVLVFVWVLGPVTQILMKYSKWFNNFFNKLFIKTREKHKITLDRYGAIFLIIFVAIPLPGSGGWTGSLIAFLFGIPYFKAVGYILAGLLLAGTIITFGITGVISFI